MSYGRHRKPPEPRQPRWHDRPRAWLRTCLDWLSGREEEVVVWDGTDDHGNHVRDDVPPVQRWGTPADRGWQTEKVGDVHVPLYGEPAPPRENPWAPCAFTPDVPRSRVQAAGKPGSTLNAAHGPGYLTMWNIRQVPSPWPPRTWPPILSGPRIAAGRIALLAGAR